MTWLHDQLKAKKWEGQPFEYAQHKLNGWRVTFFRQGDGTVVGYGKDRPKRSGSREELEFFRRFPRLHDHPVVAAIRSAPAFSSVDCEILSTSSRNSDVTTALRDPALPLDIVAFAVPWWDGVDRRKQTLEWAQMVCRRKEVPFALYFSPTDPSAVTRKQLLKLAKRDKVEGFVLKSGGQYGKWYKIKHELTVDCIVVGVEPGEGKFQDLVGAIKCAVRNSDRKFIEIASASGMDDDTRRSITSLHATGKLFGLVVEIEYQEVGSRGRLLHPRFVRFRPDKAPRDCTMDQLK